jgi:hypothetical protein
MPKGIERVSQIYGLNNNRIPVGKTKFYEDYVKHEGGEENIPGTDIPRLRLVYLGPRSSGGFTEDVDRVIEALAKSRDAAPLRPPPEHLVKGRNDAATARKRRSSKSKRAEARV